MSWASRLRRALEDAGPVAQAFAGYLSTRVDLLPVEDCADLAQATAGVAPLPAGAVRARVQAALACSPADVFEVFDDAPLRVSAFHQWHAARLEGGEAVVVKLRRPEWDAPAAAAVEALRALDGAAPGHASAAGLAEARDDFAHALERLCDLEREARELERLAAEVRSSGTFVVPRVFAALSSARLLVTEALDGRPLADWLGAEGGLPGAEDLARRLCLAWLHQALLGRALPEEPRLEDFLALPGERLALTGGVLREIDGDARRALLEHVSAAAREEPDAACASLLRVARAGAGAVGRGELLVRFRQAEPFRASLGFERYHGRRLAHTLFTYWRLARESAYVPEPELLALIRGTTALERLARRLAPEHDALGAGLADVRLVAAAVELRELWGPSRLTANVARYLPPLLDVLQRAERLQAGVGRGGHARADDAKARDPWGAFFSRLAAVVSVALLAPRALEVLFGDPWAERLASVAVLGAGWSLLAFVRRAGREEERA